MDIRPVYVKITVRCPNNPSVKYPMEMKYIITDNGSKLYAPCNGCDFLSGATICQKCTAAITMMFNYREQDINVHESISPDLSILE